MVNVRAEKLAAWAKSVNPGIPADSHLHPVSDDASFRRYFRFDQGGDGLVFVDAPPEHEDNESFVKISAALLAGGLNSPRVLGQDLDQGFMMISDLGDTLYLARILDQPDQVERLYGEAVSALVKMQSVDCDLPVYDRNRLLTEMSLFHEWFLTHQLKLEVTGGITDMLEAVYELLITSALAQPQAFVHRDYHCRNLMVTPTNSPGIIDVQDAVIGPVTYDLVSLYKDCYYRFDRDTVVSAVDDFRLRLGADEENFRRWFDLMGAQRHLKCAGIFSRLNLRDDKPGYLPDIPLVIDYLVEVAELYPELEDLGRWLTREIKPRLEQPEFRR